MGEPRDLLSCIHEYIDFADLDPKHETACHEYLDGLVAKISELQRQLADTKSVS